MSIMKKMFIATLLVSLYSCSNICYQVVSTKPCDSNINPNDMIYEDDNCIISYDLWSENGELKFTLNNKTDKVIYVNLKESWFVLNGEAHDYYMYRTFTTEYVSKKECDIISIPPYSFKRFGEFCLMKNAYKDCSINEMPTNRRPCKPVYYTKDNSPIKFRNVLTYIIEGRPIMVTNQFFVAEIFNTTEKDFITTEPATNSLGEPIGVKYVSKYRLPYNFYIKYQATSQYQSTPDSWGW